MKSCRLLKSLRAYVLILSLLCTAVPALAQNNSNNVSTPPQTTGNSSSTTTTTTTTQTSRPTQTTTTQTSDRANSNMWIWIAVLGLVALLAIAFLA
ncbi:MAG: hypothetical protein ICV68_08760, partial [Pyrinomonadaceae bacterium]|nr:hypothetical protein [Pyrinomonadaceae bacterium]